MKYVIRTITMLATVSLVACTRLSNTPALTLSPTEAATPTQTNTNNAAEEAEVRNLVENVGKRLQGVSLLSPEAAQEMQQQYSEFVSPALLETWMNDVSKAPGRMVSSPWP